MKNKNKFFVSISVLALILSSCSNHSHTPLEATKENFVDATCTMSGSYDLVTYCETCGKEMSRTHEIINPYGHDYVLDYIQEPTYEADGYKHYVCHRCGDFRDEPYGTKLEHNFSSEWSYDDNYHWHACTDHGYEDLSRDKGPHNFSPYSWTLPTYEEGQKTYYQCQTCKKTYWEYTGRSLKEIFVYVPQLPTVIPQYSQNHSLYANLQIDKVNIQLSGSLVIFDIVYQYTRYSGTSSPSTTFSLDIIDRETNTFVIRQNCTFNQTNNEDKVKSIQINMNTFGISLLKTYSWGVVDIDC